MKKSSIYCFLLPLAVTLPLATLGGWAFFKKFLEPDTLTHVQSALGDRFPNVKATADYHTVTLTGKSESPEARAAAIAAVEGITDDWGLRADGDGLQVTPAITSLVPVAAGGYALSGWVQTDAEKAALANLVAKETGLDTAKVDTSGVQALSHVLPTGAAAITAASFASTAAGGEAGWLNGLWAHLPKPPEIKLSASANPIKVTGRVATEEDKQGLANWLQQLRPGSKLDLSGVTVNAATKTLAIPAGAAALTAAGIAENPALTTAWQSLQTTPSVLFKAAADAGSPATVSGLLPVDAAWKQAITTAANLSGDQLLSSPVVSPTAETPPPAALGQLIAKVASLKDGMVAYSPAGLVVKGTVTPEQNAALRAINLGGLATDKVKFDLNVMAPPPPVALGLTVGPGTAQLVGALPTETASAEFVKFVQTLRPDLAAVDTAGLSINPAAIAPTFPEAAALLTLSDETVAANFPSIQPLWAGLKTGPAVLFDAPAKCNIFSPADDTTWARALSAGAEKASLTPGLTISPAYSVDAKSDPSPQALGQLIAAVAPLKEGHVSYLRSNGLVVKGVATPQQAAALAELANATLPAGQKQFAFTGADGQPLAMNASPAPAQPTAAMAASARKSVAAAWTDGKLGLSGPVPDEAARAAILSAVKAAAPQVEVQDGMTIQPGASLPTPKLIGDLAGQIASAPGNRKFTLNGKSVELGGEVTEELLAKWKPSMDALTAAGFPAVEPKWDIFPSLFHFPSHKVSGNMTPEQVAQMRKLLLDNQIYFDTGSAEVLAKEQPKIDAIAAAVKAAGSRVLFAVGGHADKRGNPASNQKLSQRRVASVMESLTKAGLKAEDFETVAFGASQSEASDEAALAKCRRVEILLK